MEKKIQILAIIAISLACAAGYGDYAKGYYYFQPASGWVGGRCHPWIGPCR